MPDLTPAPQAPGCCAFQSLTTCCALARSGIGCTQPMQGLLLMIRPLWKGEAMVSGMAGTTARKAA